MISRILTSIARPIIVLRFLKRNIPEGNRTVTNSILIEECGIDTPVTASNSPVRSLSMDIRLIGIITLARYVCLRPIGSDNVAVELAGGGIAAGTAEVVVVDFFESDGASSWERVDVLDWVEWDSGGQ